MTGEELDAYFQRLEEPLLDETGNWLPDPPTPDLMDPINLDLFFLMEEYSQQPNIQIFARPVERWPVARIKDFRAIRLARGKAKEQSHTIDMAWDATKAMVDPPEWK